MQGGGELSQAAVSIFHGAGPARQELKRDCFLRSPSFPTRFIASKFPWAQHAAALLQAGKGRAARCLCAHWVHSLRGTHVGSSTQALTGVACGCHGAQGHPAETVPPEGARTWARRGQAGAACLGGFHLLEG